MGDEVRAMMLGRITSNPSVLHGQPCSRDLRVPVGMILDSMAEGRRRLIPRLLSRRHRISNGA
jgi:uncharacterized protein (DUF433 family)